MKIAQLTDPESHEVGVKVRDRQIDLFDMKVDPLDDGAERRHRERRGNGNCSRRVDQRAALRRMRGRVPRNPITVEQVDCEMKPPPSYPKGFRPR